MGYVMDKEQIIIIDLCVWNKIIWIELALETFEFTNEIDKSIWMSAFVMIYVFTLKDF